MAKEVKTKESFKEMILEEQRKNETAELSDSDIVQEKETEAKKEEAEETKKVYELIKKEHGITKEQIEGWNADYHDRVYVSRFSKTETYIFRYISLIEWKNIMRQIQDAKVPDKQGLLDELLFTRCVIYPEITANTKASLPAGTIPTISSQIQVASNFISEAAAYELIFKI